MGAAKAPKILIANGVNLDLLGQREPQLYGRRGLTELEQLLRSELRRWEPLGLRAELDFFQSNCEHSYLERLGHSWDAALLNPGAWTHSSLAIADRLAALARPYVEVHVTQPWNRGGLRRRSLIAAGASGCIAGLGLEGYVAGLYVLLSAGTGSEAKKQLR